MKYRLISVILMVVISFSLSQPMFLLVKAFYLLVFQILRYQKELIPT